jgi:acetyl-CoA carboxylase carboxyltransferase component
MIPRDRQRPYNARAMIGHVVDRDSGFEIGRYYGGSLITMLARIGGRPVAVLANDPMIIGGSMDAAAASKMEKFVDLADAFNVPVVDFCDQPGFFIGPQAENAGTLKKGVRAMAAIYDARVPWATVVVRRMYGVAGAAHQAHNRYSLRMAWPSAEWGSIPIEGGVQAAYRRQIESADDPVEERKRIEREFIAVRSPFRGAEAFDIENIIDPRDTRPILARWLESAYERLPHLTGKKLHHIRP